MINGSAEWHRVQADPLRWSSMPKSQLAVIIRWKEGNIEKVEIFGKGSQMRGRSRDPNIQKESCR